MPTTCRFAPRDAGVMPIPMFDVAISVNKFEIPVTFKVGGKRVDDTLRVVTLVDPRFEVPVVLRVVANRPNAFMIAAFPLVYTLRVAMLERL